MSNQRDLRVGLGFLHAVSMRIPLRHIASSPLCPNNAFMNCCPQLASYQGGEGKQTYLQIDTSAVLHYIISFHFILYYNLLFFVLVLSVRKHCTNIKNNIWGPTAYSHLSSSAFSSPMSQSEDTWEGGYKPKNSQCSDPENRGHSSFTYFPQCKDTESWRF